MSVTLSSEEKTARLEIIFKKIVSALTAYCQTAYFFHFAMRYTSGIRKRGLTSLQFPECLVTKEKMMKNWIKCCVVIFAVTACCGYLYAKMEVSKAIAPACAAEAGQDVGQGERVQFGGSCQTCGGTGRSSIQCMSCKGTGRFGSMQCTSCRGIGWAPCTFCRGTGRR